MNIMCQVVKDQFLKPMRLENIEKVKSTLIRRTNDQPPYLVIESFQKKPSGACTTMYQTYLEASKSRKENISDNTQLELSRVTILEKEEAPIPVILPLYSSISTPKVTLSKRMVQQMWPKGGEALDKNLDLLCGKSTLCGAHILSGASNVTCDKKSKATLNTTACSKDKTRITKKRKQNSASQKDYKLPSCTPIPTYEEATLPTYEEATLPTYEEATLPTYDEATQLPTHDKTSSN